MTTVVGLVGTGVIGAGWAVRALARGFEVVATDIADDAEDRLRDSIERAWPSARRLGLFPGADPDRLTWVASAGEVAGTATFIQESVPEWLETKAAVHEELDRASQAKTVIASSSSGLLPSDMQAPLIHPERFVVGHPFNPVYLLPLVEVVPGKQTAASTVEQASDFYTDLGMHPLLVRNEIEGYLADRLQESMWREILHLVNDGIATTEELDEAIIYGPGLRWAGMGTNLTFHLAGGPGGMRHMLEQFASTLDLPWSHLEAPPLTSDLVDTMTSGAETQAGGHSIEELERLRDDYLLAVMRGLRAHRIGAGQVLARHEARVQSTGAARWERGSVVPHPLALYSCRVEPEWVDYNGHMTESAYLLAGGWATDALFRYIGIDDEYRSHHSFYTVETHIWFEREALAEQRLSIETTLLGLDSKRMHFVHTMLDEAGAGVASIEQMLVHVDMAARRSSPTLPNVQAALEAVLEAHAQHRPPVEPTMALC